VSAFSRKRPAAKPNILNVLSFSPRRRPETRLAIRALGLRVGRHLARRGPGVADILRDDWIEVNEAADMKPPKAVSSLSPPGFFLRKRWAGRRTGND
jgi:hypothetical protein